MNDRDPFDGPDTHLGERMERAVGGLRAPDVGARAMARGRRQRTRRRLTQAAGGVAAATAVALTVSAFAPGLSDRDPDPSGPSVAADPSPTGPTSAAPAAGGPADGECGPAATGWWSTPTAEVKTDLADRLPAGTRTGPTNDTGAGIWGGDLLTGDDADFARLTLLPPPGTPGGLLNLQELHDGGPCAAGSHAPMQAVRPCDELTGNEACEEIRSADGALVGVVSERIEHDVVDGQDQPTDRSYVLATVAVPGGGHVELYVAEGTRADRPDTVRDPADVPALTLDQARAIVTDPVWVG